MTTTEIKVKRQRLKIYMTTQLALGNSPLFFKNNKKPRWAKNINYLYKKDLKGRKDKYEKTSRKFQVLQIRNANPCLGTNIHISTMRGEQKLYKDPTYSQSYREPKIA